eukprot:scaffold88701_cov27-Tisochrysis_lutea.AAC.1
MAQTRVHNRWERLCAPLPRRRPKARLPKNFVQLGLPRPRDRPQPAAATKHPPRMSGDLVVGSAVAGPPALTP